MKLCTGVGAQIHSTLAPAVSKGEGLTAHPWQFTPGKEPIGVGPRTGLDVSEKRFELRTLQPISIVAVPNRLPRLHLFYLEPTAFSPQPPTLLGSTQLEDQM